MWPEFTIFTNVVQTFMGKGFLSCYHYMESYVEAHHDGVAHMAQPLPRDSFLSLDRQHLIFQVREINSYCRPQIVHKLFGRIVPLFSSELSFPLKKRKEKSLFQIKGWHMNSLKSGLSGELWLSYKAFTYYWVILVEFCVIFYERWISNILRHGISLQ